MIPRGAHPRPGVRQWVGGGVLGLVGLGLNAVASVELYPGNDLIFGGVAYLIAAVALGPGPGVLAALIASAWTVPNWGHPYGWLNFAVEAAVVGYIVGRWDRRPLTASAIFWALLGAPTLWLVYRGVLGVGGISLPMLVLKQAFNGLLAALLAEGLLLLPTLRRVLRVRSRPRLRTALAVVFSLAAILPALVLGVAEGKREWDERTEESRRQLTSEAREYAADLDRHLRLHAQAVAALGGAAERRGAYDTAALQRHLGAVRDQFPGFVNLFATDPRGVTVAFDPEVNAARQSTIGLDFSDRPYIRRVIRTRRPAISDVYRGRGGVDQALIATAVPVTLGDTLVGVVSAALDLAQLPAPELHGAAEGRLRVADAGGRLVFDSRTGYRPGDRVRTVAGSTAWRAVGEVRGTEIVSYSGAPARAAAAQTAAGVLAGATRMPSTGWVVWAERPYAVLIDSLAFAYARLLLVLLGMVFLSIALGDALARWLSGPLLRVRGATAALAGGDLDVRVGVLPAETPEEVSDLGRGFDDMAAALAERTEELEELGEIARSLASTLNTDELLRRITAAAVRLVESDGGALALRREGGRLEVVASAGPTAPPIGSEPADSHALLAMPRVTREGRDVAVPLRVSDETLGVLLVTRSDEPFASPDLALLSALADNAAVALRNARLLEAAEAASRAKSDFIATMSHELRTPLNAVLGHLELLELGIHGPVSPDQQSAFGRIGAATRHLRGLIEEVLSFARLEAGRAEVDFATHDLCEVIAEVAAVIEPLAREKGLALRVEHCPAAEPVTTDVDKVRQVVINLAGNAVKFTQQGEVRLAPTARPGGEVAITVADTGPGIDPADQARLFRPFEQLTSGYTRKHGGTGLGLYLSHRYADLLGGRIEVDSHPGRGSTFALVLPREPDPAVAQTAADGESGGAASS